jgi:hypothetical protein
MVSTALGRGGCRGATTGTPIYIYYNHACICLVKHQWTEKDNQPSFYATQTCIKNDICSKYTFNVTK